MRLTTNENESIRELLTYHVRRVRRDSIRSEAANPDRAERFIVSHGVRHPVTMGEPEANAFLTDLGVAGHVSASRQNRAMAARLFLYEAVLAKPLNQLVVRANRPKRLPVVLSRDEVRAVTQLEV